MCYKAASDARTLYACKLRGLHVAIDYTHSCVCHCVRTMARCSATHRCCCSSGKTAASSRRMCAHMEPRTASAAAHSCAVSWATSLAPRLPVTHDTSQGVRPTALMGGATGTTGLVLWMPAPWAGPHLAKALTSLSKRPSSSKCAASLLCSSPHVCRLRRWAVSLSGHSRRAAGSSTSSSEAE
jgi:hypothetical protein